MKIFLKSIVVSILTWQARAVLRKYKPKIVAVTGSVGKTSAKTAIAAACSSRFVRASLRSYNSELGVPLTILGETSGFNNPFRWLAVIFSGIGQVLFNNPYPEILVLEVGADRPGDIKKIAEWLKPDVAVMTALGTTPAHVEFRSEERRVGKEWRS